MLNFRLWDLPFREEAAEAAYYSQYTPGRLADPRWGPGNLWVPRIYTPGACGVSVMHGAMRPWGFPVDFCVAFPFCGAFEPVN